MITSPVQAYIDSIQPGRLHALGLVATAKVTLSDIARTVLQAAKDLLELVAPEEETRREVILAGLGQIFDRLAKSLPLQWRPLAPVARHILIKWLAPIVLDWLISNEVDSGSSVPSEPSKPKKVTEIVLDPDTGLPARLEDQRALGEILERMAGRRES